MNIDRKLKTLISIIYTSVVEGGQSFIITNIPINKYNLNLKMYLCRIMRVAAIPPVTVGEK